jgi:hypothetical protein
MSDMQMMLELTVVFGNPTIPNHTLLCEHERGVDDILGDMQALRETAEEQLHDTLTDEQCFYRVFTRDEHR